MRPRHADILEDFGCAARVEDFRRRLAEVGDDLTFTRDTARWCECG